MDLNKERPQKPGEGCRSWKPEATGAHLDGWHQEAHRPRPPPALAREEPPLPSAAAWAASEQGTGKAGCQAQGLSR